MSAIAIETSERKAKVKALLEKTLTKENFKNGAIETGKTLLSGILGAGAGAAIGKPALYIGLGLTFTGHLIKQPQIATFGIGMMASGGHKVASDLKGTATDGLEGAKERIKAFGNNLLESLYFDKFMKGKTNKKKEKDQTTNGLGEDVQHFKYPDNKELDMGALNAIEAELNQNGEQYEQKKQKSNTYQDIGSIEEMNF
jgi:hypothetical protein